MIFEQVYKTERERLIESYVYKDPLFEQWQKVGRIIAERKMTEPEILDLFGKIETGMTNKDTGANRTWMGRGKDVTTKAFTNTKDAFNSVMSSIQNSAPVQAVDVAYDQATDAVANLTGGQQTKVMQAIKGYRNLVKEYPKTAGFAKAALVAIAGLATGGAGLPVIAGLTYALDSAIRGDKLSSVLGKGVGASAVTWGGQQVAGALSGGDAATPDSNSQGPNVDDRIDAARARVDAANSKLGIDGSAQNYDVTGNVSQAAGVDTPLPQGATVRCPLGSCNGDAWQVKPGETFNDIAQQIGVPPEELVKLNPGLGGPGGTYTIVKGDQLGFIAQANGTTVEAIRAANPDIDFSKALQPGQEINLPAAGTPGQGSVWSDYKGGMYGDKAAGQTAGMSQAEINQMRNQNLFRMQDQADAAYYADKPDDFGIPPRSNDAVGTGMPGSAGGYTERYIPQKDGTWIDASTGKVADAAKLQASQDAVRNALRSGFRESIKFKTLPVDKLFDDKLTVMSWALNESVGKPAGHSVHLTTLGVYTVFENVNRYARAVVKEAVGPGRPDLPDEFRPDMSGGSGGYDKSKKGIVGKGLDWLDRATGKVGGALSKFGHQFNTKVTKEKLKMDWHQAGKPSDSDAIAAFLAKQGVPQNVIGDVYSSMSIPVPAPTPAPVVPSPYGKGDPEKTKVTVTKLSNDQLQSFISKATDPANPHVQIAKAELAKRQAGGAQTQLPYYGINPVTKKPWTVDELQAKATATKQTTPVNTTTTTTTTPSTSGATFNASNVMQMPGMQKYAKTAPAAPAKTANFGASPTGYGKTTTTFKAPAAPNAPTAPTVPAVTAGPGGSYNPKTGAAKIDGKSAVALKDLPADIQKQLQPQLEATKKQVSKMLESVQTKSDVDRIKKYVDQQFATIGLTENTVRYRKKLMDHITHVGSIRRRMHASSVGN